VKPVPTYPLTRIANALESIAFSLNSIAGVMDKPTPEAEELKTAISNVRFGFGVAQIALDKLEDIVRGDILESVDVAAPLAAELQMPGLVEDVEELS
jgi:hypothetical protein